MTADSIARLSRKLLASCLAEDGSVFLHSNDYREDIALLRDPLRDTTLQFLEETRSQIPTDFSFSLSFDFNGVNVSLEFEDGNTASFGRDAYFTSFKSMRRHLLREKWDDLRLTAIQEGGIFEKLVSEAQDRPVNIPSSEEAAKRYAMELAQGVAAIRAIQPIPPFALITAEEQA